MELSHIPFIFWNNTSAAALSKYVGLSKISSGIFGYVNVTVLGLLCIILRKILRFVYPEILVLLTATLHLVEECIITNFAERKIIHFQASLFSNGAYT